MHNVNVNPISGHDPPAVCLPVHKIPILLVCVDFHSVDYVNNMASGCVKVSGAISRWGVSQNIGTIDLGCFKFAVGQMRTRGLSSAGLLRIMNKRLLN